MIDFDHQLVRIVDVSRDDKALLRSNLSARLMPEDGQEHMLDHVLLSSCSSFGRKAINLLSWCKALTKVKQTKDRQPVGHMSGLAVRCSDSEAFFVICSVLYNLFFKRVSFP